MGNSQSTGRSTDTLVTDDTASDAMVVNVTHRVRETLPRLETMKDLPLVVCPAGQESRDEEVF